MGEKSKLIGEYGEKSVENFLKLIGWGKAHQNIEFSCTKENHKKRTHGLDFFFTYKSPLVDLVLKKINISVKFSDKPYPNSPSSTFKNHFEDLATAIECFKTSQQSKQIISGIRNYTKSEDVGLLFWLTNDETSYDDLIPKLANVRFSKDYSYDSLYIVDNKRIDFIYSCLKYAISKFKDSDITFFYPDTGKNIIPTTKKNFGKILPIEYINSSILPLRIEEKITKTTTLALYTIEPFDISDLKRLISLSKELSKSWPSKIVILFPDYNEVRNSSDVRIAKSAFEEETFTDQISVESYNDNFKSLQI
ncbi:GapS4a family protein [Lacinutrix salivirga]